MRVSVSVFLCVSRRGVCVAEGFDLTVCSFARRTQHTTQHSTAQHHTHTARRNSTARQPCVSGLVSVLPFALRRLLSQSAGRSVLLLFVVAARLHIDIVRTAHFETRTLSLSPLRTSSILHSSYLLIPSFSITLPCHLFFFFVDHPTSSASTS